MSHDNNNEASFVQAPSKASPWSRAISLTLASAMLWCFSLFPATAAVKDVVQANHETAVRKVQAATTLNKAIRQSLRHRHPVLMMAQSPRIVPPATGKIVPLSTLLDQGGRLIRKVSASEIATWKAQLSSPSTLSAAKAQIHDYLGEWRLDSGKDPIGAIEEFAIAQQLTSPGQAEYGLAQYDTAITHFRSGAYRRAAAEFHEMVTAPRTAGYDRQECALWDRHAQVCDGYHAAHAKLGIPEPPKLDPLCGAAAIATSLKALNLPWDKKTVLRSCRVTGLGSTLRDLANAGRGLGVNIHPVHATDEGLKELPKPLIAYVERDHFIAVVKADNHGVSYLCSDCGPWPGGLVNLTWMQWHTMNPGIYATVTRVGTLWDRAITAQADPKDHGSIAPPRSSTQVAMLDLNAKILPYAPALPVLKGVEFKQSWYIDDITCGYSGWFGGDCADCMICCLLDSGGGMGGSLGDPVNLATGGEEYTPSPDLVVYNPHGPSVTWQRLYNSLRSIEERDSAHQATWSYEDADFGYAWSQQYNIQVVTGSTTDYLVLPNGARIGFTGTAPTSGSPLTNCTVQAGAPVLIKWLYNSSTSNTYFTVTWGDRTVWTTTKGTSGWQLAQITDRNGNSIYFNYGATLFNGYYTLNTITDQPAGAGTQLLTIVRNSSGHINVVTDCYGRSVYYHVMSNGQPNASTVDYVSQIVPSCSGSVPIRYQYGYVWKVNSESVQPSPFLHTISVPSPTGSGMSTATINYATSGAPFISSLVDANGNKRTYIQLGQLDTKVTVTNAAGATVYTYTGTYDNNMSGVSTTDGTGQLLSQSVFSDPNDPYRPSAMLNAIAARAAISSNSIYIGYTGVVPKSGSALPTSGTWQVLNSSSTVVGSSSTTNGWKVSYNSGTSAFTITVPVSASAGTGYEVKYASVGSAVFNALSSSTTGWGIANATWDQYGNMLTCIDPRGVTTSNVYSYSNFALGELQSTQDSYVSGGTTYYKTATSYTYDDSDGYDDAAGVFHPCGLFASVSSPTPGTSGTGSQVTSTYTYDLTGQGAKSLGNLGLGNILTITTPGNNATSTITTTFNYTTDGAYSQGEALGQRLTATDNLGNVIHARYDSRGNKISLTDALGNARICTYTLSDELLQVTFPATGQTGTGQSYDVNSYLYTASISDPTQEYGPLVAVTAYDEGGSLVTQTDHTYGLEGEMLSTAGAVQPVTATYDALYRTTSISDGNSHATTYTYNSAGYCARINYPGSGSATSGADTVQFTSYDANGDLLQRIDGRGVTTNYTYYDPESRLTSIAYPASTGINVSYTYDNLGRKATITDGTGSISYSYDDTDRMTAAVTTYAGLSALTLSYAYYANGAPETLTTPVGNFSYSYDAGGRMTSLTNPNSETSSWTYQNNNWLSTQTLANGAVTTYTYNPRGFLTDLINQTSGGATLSDFGSMTYNGVGDRTAITAAVPAATTYSGTTDYSYDTILTGGTRNQLTGETSTRVGGYSETNAYDAAGNPTTFRSSSMSSYNSDNQTTATGFSYDGNGNPTTYGGTSLAFDAENRLTAYGSVLSAGYNGYNQRAWKTNSAGTTYFLYDAMLPVIELNSSGTVTAYNTFGPTGLLSRYSASSSTFYTFDPQGSTTQRLDASESVLDTNAYDGFGVHTSTGSSTDPYCGFGSETGYYHDYETGLSSMAYRYYDSSKGRFINRDPIGVNGGVNVYSYCGNSTTNAVDPAGLWVGGVNGGGTVVTTTTGTSGGVSGGTYTYTGGGVAEGGTAVAEGGTGVAEGGTAIAAGGAEAGGGAVMGAGPVGIILGGIDAIGEIGTYQPCGPPTGIFTYIGTVLAGPCTPGTISLPAPAPVNTVGPDPDQFGFPGAGGPQTCTWIICTSEGIGVSASGTGLVCKFKCKNMGTGATWDHEIEDPYLKCLPKGDTTTTGPTWH